MSVMSGLLHPPATNRATRIVGSLTVVGIGALLWLGLVVSPNSVQMGDLVRLIYVHPACAFMAYAGFAVCALASLAYLWPRTRSPRWDRVAGASAEVGVVFCAATIVTGSIWGRSTWGVWWTWDPLLTLTALLLIAFVGYLALRRTGGDPEVRAKRSAIAALACFVVVPVDHEATSWWAGLHQSTTTLFSPGHSPLIHGWELVTMLLSFVVFALIFTWLFLHRLAVETLADRVEHEGTVWAIVERRAEGTPTLAGAAASTRAGTPAGIPTAGGDPLAGREVAAGAGSAS
jgi:heme exporter protein C